MQRKKIMFEFKVHLYYKSAIVILQILGSNRWQQSRTPKLTLELVIKFVIQSIANLNSNWEDMISFGTQVFIITAWLLPTMVLISFLTDPLHQQKKNISITHIHHVLFHFNKNLSLTQLFCYMYNTIKDVITNLLQRTSFLSIY